MKIIRRLVCILLAALCLLMAGCASKTTASAQTQPTTEPTAEPTPAPISTPEPADYSIYQDAKDAAVSALAEQLRAARECVYVYHEFSDTQNHFTQKAKMAGRNSGLVLDMDENWQLSPFDGRSCIRCEQKTAPGDWGGWLFLNGYLPEGESTPHLNDGSADGQGLNLSGARELRFYARGENGGETVEFFTAGFGYDGEWGTQLVDYPDSSRKQTLGYVTLSTDWEEYVIPLYGVDMSYTVCGFGYVLSGDRSGSSDSVFYLDEIRFIGSFDAAEMPVLLRSYETDNVYIQNAAFSYDNALAAMAFLSEGMREEAEAILNAFLYAVVNDRQEAGRVRNAYAAGNIGAFPGWDGGARLPGWYDAETGVWYEDRYQVGSNVGNTSYVALALLQYYTMYGDERYLDTARILMDWVLFCCKDGTPGYTGGFDGWAEGPEPTVYWFSYKSIEHNIDAYAAFRELYALTGNEEYREAADSALTLIRNMYDEEECVFYTGTGNDGITPSTENIVLDAQVWSALALGDEFAPFEKCLKRVASMRTNEGGYPFCESNETGGWWAEGTAYTALMYRMRGEDLRAVESLNALCNIQSENGLFPAATVEELPTGFALFDGSPWVYSDDIHIAPAAWFVMAVNGFNPYSF